MLTPEAKILEQPWIAQAVALAAEGNAFVRSHLRRASRRSMPGLRLQLADGHPPGRRGLRYLRHTM